jgi:hypothetical protein
MKFKVCTTISENATYDHPYESASQTQKVFSTLWEANKYFFKIFEEWKRSYDSDKSSEKTFCYNNSLAGNVSFTCKILGKFCDCGIYFGE